jgi:four helix bundle protein
MQVKSFRDLIAWQKAIDLIVTVYQACREYPRDEIYGLTSQTKRSAVSVASNIAEGQARNSTREFQHFLSIANGSLAELETQLVIAHRLEFLGDATYQPTLAMVHEVGRIINGLRNSLPKH